MNRIRRKLVPRSVTECISVLTLSAFIVLLYWFQLFMILPKYYGNGYVYLFHCLLSTFFMFNITGNYVYLYLTNTSIEGLMLSTEAKANWKFCDICETVSPPRSWHCSVCNICILKRDHHCTFSASCVGHFNHRYFLFFIFYLALGGLYCSYFSVIFLYETSSFAWSGIIKLVFPLAMFVLGTDMSFMQIYRILCITEILGAITMGFVTFYFFESASRGVVNYEKAKGIKDYQMESVKENLIQVLGKRWYLTWISPFIVSELPCDGVNWVQLKMNTNKNK